MQIQKVREWLHEVAKIIKSVGTILGLFAFAYVAAANWFSSTSLGDSVISIGDQLINTDRLAENYVYYEVGLDGFLTDDGRFLPSDLEKPRPYRDLNVDDVLNAASTVRIRSAPSSSGEILGNVEAGTCVKVLAAEWPLNPSQLGSASSGGWLHVERTAC